MNFDELYQKTLLEKIIGQKAKLLAKGIDLGKDFPFRDGDIVKITKFMGYSLGKKEFKIESLDGKESGIVTAEMLQIL